ncbi:MAG: 2-deoxystreptamine glucosyltransferase, partial [Bacteroidota bacterium]
MGQKIAMLLNGPIFNDYRVIKMIQTLGKENSVDLYYIDGNVLNDKQLFAENIRLFNFSKKKNLKTKILQHSFFCYEFNFFINEVLKSKVKYDIILSNDLPTLYPGYKISKKLNSNLFYDSHEIYTETINQFFPKKNPFFKSLIFNFLIFF